MNMHINKMARQYFDILPHLKALGLWSLLALLALILNVAQVQASGLANLMKYAQSNGTMTNVNKGKVAIY